MTKRIAPILVLAVVSLALPGVAGARKHKPYLTVARAKAAIKSMGREEGGADISVTACRRGTATRIACNLTESGVVTVNEGPAMLTERITVRLIHGKLKLSGSLRESDTEPELAGWHPGWTGSQSAPQSVTSQVTP
jgi:hypothetical protein